MLKYQIILSFIFLINKITLLECDRDICFDCYKYKVDEYKGCKCCNCTPFKILCYYNDCKICQEEGEHSVGDCICSECEPIKFSSFYMNPVEVDYSVSFSQCKSNKNKTVSLTLSIIFLSLFVIIICLLYFFVLKKKYIEINNIRNQIIMYNMNNNNNIGQSENKNLKKELTKEQILRDPHYLGPKKCKKEFEKYNNRCSICLKRFKIGIDYISLTPCNHLFHYKCLNGYFKKTEEIKCPNCNYKIFEHYKKEI